MKDKNVNRNWGAFYSCKELTPWGSFIISVSGLTCGKLVVYKNVYHKNSEIKHIQCKVNSNEKM